MKNPAGLAGFRTSILALAGSVVIFFVVANQAVDQHGSLLQKRV